MRIAVLGSGSRGNAVVVESNGARLLIDAGFSCREIEKRLQVVGVSAEGFEGIILTHEHGDHTRGVDRFVRRHEVPLYGTAGTLGELSLSGEAAARTTAIASGEKREIGPFVVEPFFIPHDAREPVGFVVEDSDGHRLGLAADLGSRSRLAWARLAEVDVLLLETNHDLEMLRSGPYPWHLKQRVAGRHGHLSNHDAAQGLPELVCDRLRWVMLYHLSQTNNLPALAAATIGEELDRLGCRAQTVVTEQNRPSPWVQVGE